MFRSSKLLPVLVFVLLLAGLPSCFGRPEPDLAVNLPPPDWDFWDSPSAVMAMLETDPAGDDLGFGLVADWSEMRGTYDPYYIYIRVDVHSSPNLDDTGGVHYRVFLDANNSGFFDVADYILSYNLADGFTAEDFKGDAAGAGARFRLNAAGGIDFAFPRHLVNYISFGVRAYVECWHVVDLEPGDEMPDAVGGPAVFAFN